MLRDLLSRFGWRGGTLLLVAVVAGAAVGAAVAGTASWYRVASDGNLAPGGTARTDPQLNRDYNVACRSGNSGQMSVQYMNGSPPSVVHNSGTEWTNCPTTVKLTFGGNYYSRCKNEGTVSFPVVCETTVP